MVTPLSLSLREGTKDSHRLAEKTPFIRSFFAGTLSIDMYREFLVQLNFIYASLEEAQRIHQENNMVAKIYFPSLFRNEAIRKDLNYYFKGDTWKKQEPGAATRTYTTRIKTLSQEWPAGLVAHHYTRYLGDLSGGQTLKRIIARSFNLLDGDGLAFYEFDQISDQKQFKNEYRMRLDSMLLDEKDTAKMVTEANYAFQLNSDVFGEILSE